MAAEHHILNNGIRIVHIRTNSSVAYCGMMINTGTRDEYDDEHGIAHFIEHIIFKGTKKRKAFHIMSRLEDVGGELNAYTTKEETVIHATFLKDDFNRAAELISDIVFHSTFPEKELKKEREVILYFEHIKSIVDLAVKNYLERDFSHLSISFGCTGGQHRSVYFAEKLSNYLLGKYPVTTFVHHNAEKNWVLK